MFLLIPFHLMRSQSRSRSSSDQSRSSHVLLSSMIPYSSSSPPILYSILIFISISFLLLYCTHTMTIKGGTSQACAACKYQRRKCSKDCPLAPFFPADQQEKFQHAHRLYGVRNIMSILKVVPSECKQDAMRSIIFESSMRAKYPVHGCVGVINQLQAQLEYALEELHLVHTRLAICKQQEASSSSHDHSSSLQLTMASNTDVLPVQQHHIFQPDSSTISMPMVPNYDLLANGINNMYLNPNFEDIKLPMMIQNPSFSSVEPVARSPFYASQEYPVQQELDVSQYDDIPFDPMIDDRSQEPYDSSGESLLKNKMVESEYNDSKTDFSNSEASVSKTELTHAAASFSLMRGQG